MARKELKINITFDPNAGKAHHKITTNMNSYEALFCLCKMMLVIMGAAPDKKIGSLDFEPRKIDDELGGR